MIWLGAWLLPAETIFAFNIEAVQSWNVWSFLGVVFIGSGIYGLLKEAVFAVRAHATSGEWHFRLTDRDLLWHVPNHAHGKEVGFEAKLEELKQIEFRTLKKYEDFDEREYWVHFHSRASVQLQSYSGMSLSWLAEKISAAGVPYEETQIDV